MLDKSQKIWARATNFKLEVGLTAYFRNTFRQNLLNICSAKLLINQEVWLDRYLQS